MAITPDRYEDISTVITMLPVPLTETKPGLHPGSFLIPAVRNPMKDVAVVHIARAKFPVYIDENRPALIVPEPSDIVAESICRDYRVAVMDYEPGRAEPGLFWVKEKWSIEEVLSGSSEVLTRELKKYRELQIEWFKRMVSRADDEWARIRQRRAISDLQRHAAVALGLTDKEWNINTIVEKALDVCKFCRTPVAREAMVCGNCGGVLDLERYRKEFVSAQTLAAMGLGNQKA